MIVVWPNWLSRSLASRRGLFTGLTSGLLSVLSFRLGSEHAAARKKRRKNRRRKKKRKPSPPPPAPTCSDGITNGSESDVDCGGACPRCADGSTCVDGDDCASAHCRTIPGSGLKFCLPCSDLVDPCAPDAAGNPCLCDTTVSGQTVCNPILPAANPAACTQCPSGTNCVDADPNDGAVQCFQPCAAP